VRGLQSFWMLCESRTGDGGFGRWSEGVLPGERGKERRSKWWWKGKSSFKCLLMLAQQQRVAGSPAAAWQPLQPLQPLHSNRHMESAPLQAHRPLKLGSGTRDCRALGPPSERGSAGELCALDRHPCPQSHSRQRRRRRAFFYPPSNSVFQDQNAVLLSSSLSIYKAKSPFR